MISCEKAEDCELTQADRCKEAYRCDTLLFSCTQRIITLTVTQTSFLAHPNRAFDHWLTLSPFGPVLLLHLLQPSIPGTLLQC